MATIIDLRISIPKDKFEKLMTLALKRDNDWSISDEIGLAIERHLEMHKDGPVPLPVFQKI